MTDYDKLKPGDVFVWAGLGEDYLVLSRDGDRFVLWWNPSGQDGYDPDEVYPDRNAWSPDMEGGKFIDGIRAAVKIVPIPPDCLVRWVAWLKEQDHDDV